ncbi:ABC transporter ATP-binding protein [bacterium]|nr:ABC transporter ATP-binding protein [bacterium]
MSAVLEAIGLSKSYQHVLALDCLDLNVEPGEVLALLGPNGSGKSTSIRCFAGLLQPSAGRVKVAGYDLHRDYREARRQFSYLPQQASFPGTLSVYEAISFHASLRGCGRTEAEAALVQVGLLNGVWKRPVAQLSGGMRQRLALAVASLGDAPLVLLDEPTANLDPEAAISFRDLAREWRGRGRAIVLSTHVLGDVEALADRVLVLVAGKVVARESIADLRLRLSRFARLLVDVGKAEDKHRSAALSSGAVDVQLNCCNILVTAPVENRLQILDSLSRVGSIRHFETEKPALEDIYLDYVRQSAGTAGTEELDK